MKRALHFGTHFRKVRRVPPITRTIAAKTAAARWVERARRVVVAGVVEVGVGPWRTDPNTGVFVPAASKLSTALLSVCSNPLCFIMSVQSVLKAGIQRPLYHEAGVAGPCGAWVA